MENDEEGRERVFYGNRRSNETKFEWLKRIMNEPLQGDLDEQVIKDKIEAIERDRQKRHEDFYAACLELHAWAAARPLVEHQRAVGLAETRVYECITEEENQTQMVEHLQAFATMIQNALSFLKSKEISTNSALEQAEQCDVEMKMTETPRVPKVLVPNSSQ
ncbi:hypothetical protein FRB91_008761 [Serendipita sp. 411]|nr:hypothetical protein FRC16_008509 [Serendipita sp. 398]KAG8859175.1 hypothetical protein FRB91_008761 [Serendipita sp. 411]